MRTFKATAILISFMVYLILATCFYIIITFLKSSRRRHFMNLLGFFLIRFLRKLIGIHVHVKGRLETLKEKGNFIISRHIGYVDGLILGSLLPVMLLSKKEIKGWPLIGQVVWISGTVFVDRDHKNKIAGCLKELVCLLQGKSNVVVFPEGTSTDGTVIKPFQSVFFQAPIAAQAAVVPVTISYKRIDGREINSANKNNIYWYGQIGFFDHLWNLLKCKAIEAEVTIHEKIATLTYQNNSLDRKELCQRCYRLIDEAAQIKNERSIYRDNKDSVLVPL